MCWSEANTRSSRTRTFGKSLSEQTGHWLVGDGGGDDPGPDHFDQVVVGQVFIGVHHGERRLSGRLPLRVEGGELLVETGGWPQVDRRAEHILRGSRVRSRWAGDQQLAYLGAKRLAEVDDGPAPFRHRNRTGGQIGSCAASGCQPRPRQQRVRKRPSTDRSTTGRCRPTADGRTLHPLRPHWDRKQTLVGKEPVLSSRPRADARASLLGVGISADSRHSPSPWVPGRLWVIAHPRRPKIRTRPIRPSGSLI